MTLGILHHLVDLAVRETAGSLDPDLLFLAGRLVLRRHVQDAVGVDVKSDLDLRYTSRRGRDTGQLEPPKGAVVDGHLALTLQDMDLHGGLSILGRRKDFRFLRRNRRVALNQNGGHTAECLNTQRQRSHVEQQHVLDLSGKHATLNRGANAYDLVRVHSPVWLLAKEFLDDVLNLRDAGRTTHQDHLVDLRRLELGVRQRLLHGCHRPLHEIIDQLLELRPGQRHVEVFGPRLIRRHKWEIDLRLLSGRKLHLGFLGRFLEALQRHGIL